MAKQAQTTKKLGLAELIQSRSTRDSSRNKFWKQPVHLPGFGTVTGKVTLDQLEVFLKTAPKETDLVNWISENDPVEDRKKEALEKMKRKVGLQE